MHGPEFPNQLPQNSLDFDPWNASSADLSSPVSVCPAEPANGSDTPISLAQNQDPLQLPNFTGKIRKADEYPFGRGGFADVWKGVLDLPSGECKVCCDSHNMHMKTKLIKLMTSGGRQSPPNAHQRSRA